MPAFDTQGEASIPSAGRAALVGYAVGFAVATVVLTVGGTLAGLGLWPSLGLGTFVGIWGGGGFGLMIGGPLALRPDALPAPADPPS